MKLLRVRADHFKNCQDGTEIDFVAKPETGITYEDNEYELIKIADGLYIHSTMAFIGKNASGKTTALELLDACYSILGRFGLSDKNYDYDGVCLEIIFYHDGYVYKYTTNLQNCPTIENRAVFCDQHISCKKYCKAIWDSIYDHEGFQEMTDCGRLPEDVSIVFFVLKKKQPVSMYYGRIGEEAGTYQELFKLMKNYQISEEMLSNIIRIFDKRIDRIHQVNDFLFTMCVQEKSGIYSDSELIHYLSSGTTKGILLYMMMAVSLRNGLDLLVDGIETHFSKSLVENMIGLYKDKSVNKNHAALVFTTHYCEVLDHFGCRDGIWVCQSDGKIKISNLYDTYGSHTDSPVSRQYYNNDFHTAVDYEGLMVLKRGLMG